MILQETAMSNAWYEVLSVLLLMAMLSLSQANLLLLPRTSADGYQPKVSEGACNMLLTKITLLVLCVSFLTIVPFFFFSHF